MSDRSRRDRDRKGQERVVQVREGRQGTAHLEKSHRRSKSPTRIKVPKLGSFVGSATI